VISVPHYSIASVNARCINRVVIQAGPMQGAVYKGHWRSGVIHGEGQLTWPDGRCYTGQFTDGEQTG